MDWEWDNYLSKEVPKEYMDELQGMQDAGALIGQPDLGKQASRYSRKVMIIET